MAQPACVQIELNALSEPSSARLTTTLWSSYSSAPPLATSLAAPRTTGAVGVAGVPPPLPPPEHAARPSPATGVSAAPRRTVRRLADGRPDMASPLVEGA